MPLKKCIISKNKFKKSQKYKAWITNGLLVSIKNRHKLYLKKHKAPFDLKLKNHYIKYRNLLNSLIRKSCSSYFKNQFYLSKHNIKNTWKLINEATYSTKKEETPITCIESSSTNSFLTDKIDI